MAKSGIAPPAVAVAPLSFLLPSLVTSTWAFSIAGAAREKVSLPSHLCKFR